VNEVVLLKMGELREFLVTDVAFEGSLASVSSQVNLEIAQLTKRLAALLALVSRLSVHLNRPHKGLEMLYLGQRIR
jgi:hypothetical protein